MRSMLRVLVATLALAGLAAAAASLRAASAADTPAGTARAQQAYLAYCAMCHGPQGAGDGDVAAMLKRSSITVPRLDDAAALDKLGRAGILRIIVQGGAHTGRSNIMPEWGQLVGRDLAGDLADYVMGIPNRTTGVPAATIEKYLRSPAGVPGEGRRLYVYHCSACHGPNGKGDGPSGIILLKKRGVRPRNLTDTRYLASKTDKDLFAVISLGGAHLGKSASMPNWDPDLTPVQIKDLVAYLREISRTRARP